MEFSIAIFSAMISTLTSLSVASASVYTVEKWKFYMFTMNISKTLNSLKSVSTTARIIYINFKPSQVSMNTDLLGKLSV